MSGLTVALTTTKTLSTSVEFTATCMYAGDTGVVIVYKNNSEVSRSESVTIASGSSASVTVSGLSPHTLYNAVFYSTITQIEASESVSFITTGSRMLYGSVNDKAKKITTLYGGVNNQAEKVTKFYGSVNGETKLIHQGFGHLDYTPYGYITYYTDNTHTTTAVAPIRTQEELDGFANHSGGGNWSTTIDFGRVTVSTRGDHAIKMISFTNKTTVLKPYFLWGANYLDGEIVLPSSLTRINMAFLYACDSPNITVNVGNLSANIGIETSSYPYFLSAGSSSYGSYTTGIKIAGANRAAWMTKFPNMDTTPYRKLVDAGY